MQKITIQFCSPIETDESLYNRIDDRLGLYYEADYVGDRIFEREPDSGSCRAVHIEVDEIFHNKLVDDMVEVLEDDHGCDVVVLEDGEESVVSGECTIKA